MKKNRSSKPQKLTKSHYMIGPNFSKLTGTLTCASEHKLTLKLFYGCLLSWYPDKIRRKCTCGWNCAVKCPKSKMNELLLNIQYFRVFLSCLYLNKISFNQKITSKIFTPVNPSLSRGLVKTYKISKLLIFSQWILVINFKI